MMNEQLKELLQEIVPAELKRWEIPCCGISIVKDGEILYEDSIGLRDNESLKGDAHTYYQIASCSKAFTATLAGVLATEGLLDFDTPIIEYMPNFRMSDRYATENLTIRDFLSHRSGLPRHEYAWYGSGFSRDELLKNVKDLPINAPLRYRFQYSNFNYLIVGCLIEAVTGRKFEEVLVEKLLKPIGMTESFVYLNKMDTVENKALPFNHAENYTMTGIRPIKYYSSPAASFEESGDPTAAAGCIVSTPHDMTQWLKFNLNKGKVGDQQLVREDLMALITTPHIDTGDGGFYEPERGMTSYALGWSIYNYRGMKMVEHGGNLNGQSSSTSFVPALNLGVFTSVNMDTCLFAEALVQAVIDAVLGKLHETDWLKRAYDANDALFKQVIEIFASFGGTPVPNTTPTHPLEDYLGDYEAPGYRRFRIEMKDGGLFADFNTFTGPLRHFHYDSFETVNTFGELPPGLLITFAPDTKGQISTLSVTLGTEYQLKPIVFTKKEEA